MSPLILAIPSGANATVNNQAWVGRINADQIVSIQDVSGTATITMTGGIVITVAIAWIQANWKPLFYDMLSGIG